MRALWQFARLEDTQVLLGLNLLGKSGLLRGKVGIECPTCGAHYLIVQARGRVFLILLWLSVGAAAALIGEWASRHFGPLDRMWSYVVALPLLCTALLIQRYCLPRLAQLRPVYSEEGISFPLKSAYPSAEHLAATSNNRSNVP